MSISLLPFRTLLNRGCRAFVASAALAVLLAGCAEKDTAGPTDPTAAVEQAPGDRMSTVIGCTNNPQKQVDNLLPQLFVSGNQRGEASNLNAAMKKAIREGRTDDALALGSQLIQFTLQNYNDGLLIGGTSAETQARVEQFITYIYCALGIPGVDLGGNLPPGAILITPTTPDTVVRSANGQAGAKFYQGTIPSFPGVVVNIITTTDTLNTSLDKVGPLFEFSITPYLTFAQDVLTGICAEPPPGPADDYRLAHNVASGYVANPAANQTIDGIEILAIRPVEELGLEFNGELCTSAVTAYAPGLKGFLQRVIDAVGPEPLYARGSGGYGGGVRNLSPFQLVDRKLKVTKNAASESAVAGQAAATPPSVTISTRVGNKPRPGIQVAFATSTSGASISPATVTTLTNGTAAATSWTLALGANTATATPSAKLLTFDVSPVTFEATGVAGVAITSTSPLPAGEVGTAYSQALTASGGTAPYTWALKAGSSLPGGLSLSNGGALTGNPTAFGTFTFTITVTGTIGGTAEKLFSLTIAPPPVEIVDPLPPVDGKTPLPAATQGASYSQQLTATGGTGTYEFELAAGDSLPAGLSLSSSGLLSGTPSVFGTFNFDVTVNSGPVSSTTTFQLIISPPAVVITTTTLPAGTVGTPYAATLAASGGNGTYAWSVTGGALPGGVTLSGNTLSGTPSASGTFNFAVTAASTGATSGSKALSIVVSPPPVVVTSASPLPAGQKGVTYSQSLTASGGTGTYSWSLVSGALPGGLTLGTGGTLSGTPTATGVFNFRVQAASSPATPGQKDLSLTIGLPPITALTLAFVEQPSGAGCNLAITPSVTVSVRDQNGDLRPGVTVSIAAVDNNGTPVTVSGTPVVSGANGSAVFTALSISKTGSYRLVASTISPTASVRSQKFNVSPPCQ
jgi:hypothetical protein